jgi:integrase
MIVQRSLFDLHPERDPEGLPRKGALDSRSEALLARYQQLRLVSGGHPRTASREVSQLRSLARELGTTGSLPDVFRDVQTLAGLLLDPSVVISASTGRCRLVAAQRFARLCGDQLGIANVERFLIDLDSLLPGRNQREWHSAGSIVAGTRSRRRPLGPTLDPVDLERIMASVTGEPVPRERRDRALVALHCYSGLRPDEMIVLQWAQVVIDPESEQGGIRLQRRGLWVCLLLGGPAIGPLLALLCTGPGCVSASGAGYIFSRGEHGDRPLTSRTVREIVHRACQRAGFPLATASDLRAAFACWLRARGLSDHETATVLGLRQVCSLDRLLARHRALDAQRRVRGLSPDP